MADTAATGPGVERFGLLASGIAGRAVRVAPTGPGERAWTDGTAIYVDPSTAVSEQLIALAVQSSLLAAGSLEPDILRRLRGRSALADRYLAVEGHRALSVTRDVLPPRILPIIDDILAVRLDSAPASLAVALGGERLAAPPGSFGAIYPKALLAPGGSDDGPQNAHDTEPEGTGRGGAGFDAIDTDDSGQFGRIPSFSADLVGGGGLLARLLQRALALGRNSEGGITGGAVPRAARTVIRPIHRVATVGIGALVDVETAHGHGAVYPEWDVHRGRYRPGWCTVTESLPLVDDTRPLPVPATRHLRRPLVRLNSSPDRLRRRMQGDDLDVDAVVAEQVAVAAGSSPDDAVYIENVRRAPDLTVLVLLDVSGSSGTPSPAGGTVHDQQRAAVAALTAALHGLGNQVALYGFCSRGRSAVQLLRVKRFADRLDAVAMRRLAALAPGAYTRLGAVIRHGAALADQPGGLARRLLVVVSDGLAYDQGYESGYAEADARRALAEARRRGIGCVCLSVGAHTDLTDLRRVFGTAAHATVNSPDDLPRVVGPLFRSALRSAQWRQKAYRRSARTERRHEVLRRSL